MIRCISLRAFIAMINVMVTAHVWGAPDHKLSTITVPVEVSVQGEGYHATRWLAIRKAQMLLAEQLPSVVHYTTELQNNDISTVIHETLAQTVAMQIEHLDISVKTLGKRQPPDYQGTSLHRYDKNSDDAGNPMGTKYQAHAKVIFLVLPAALVERARLLQENRLLAAELQKQSRSRNHNVIGHHPHNRELLDQLNAASLRDPQMTAMNEAYRQQMAEGRYSDGVEAVAEMYHSRQTARQEALARTQRSQDLRFYRDREQDVEKFVDDAYQEREYQYQSFIKSLPAAFANTATVKQATLQPTEWVGTFGMDLYFFGETLKRMKEQHNLNLDMAVPATDRLTLEMDYSCDFGTQPESARLNMCQLWELLPRATRNRIQVEGLYAGDYRYTDYEVNALIRGRGYPYNPAVLRMPTAGSLYGKAAGRVFNGFENGLVDKGLNGFISAIYQYNGSAATLPDMLAAGFVGRPPVTLTVMFPGTREYIDIPLTSDRYLLRPSLISLYLQVEQENPAKRRQRQQDIRAVVWWPGDQHEQDHPAGKGWSPVAGGLHYANLPRNHDDYGQFRHLRWLREHYAALNNNVIGGVVIPEIPAKGAANAVETWMSRGACGGWVNLDYMFNLRRGMLPSECKRHLVLQYGRKPQMDKSGLDLIIGKNEDRNNPMLPLQICLTQPPMTREMAGCTSYFNGMTSAPMGTVAKDYMASHDIWESIRKGATGDSEPASDKNYTTFSEKRMWGDAFW